MGSPCTISFVPITLGRFGYMQVVVKLLLHTSKVTQWQDCGHIFPLFMFT